MEALIGPSVAASRGCDCCNGEQSVSAQSSIVAGQFSALQPVAVRNVAAAGGNTLGFAGNPSALSASSGPIRMLDPSQQAAAVAVYGTSLDFSTIFITDKTGLGNRPFTVAFPDKGQIVQIMNCGTFSPSKDTLIHELCHVWQSQHHSDKFRYMVNAVDSQAGAAVANAAAVADDPIVMLNKDFPLFWPFDAYASNPGLPFTSLAAEQMASAVERGVSAIVAHVRGIAMNAVDPACVTALSKPGFADRRMPGVK